MTVLLGITAGVAYYLIGVIVDRLVQGPDTTPSIFVMLFWPIFVALFIVLFPMVFTYELIKRLRNKNRK